jgi:hypothetical protein
MTTPEIVIALLPNLANSGAGEPGSRQVNSTSAHAKNPFAELIDAARAAPVAITK